MENSDRKKSEIKRRIIEGLKLASSRILMDKKRSGGRIVTIVNDEVVHLTVSEYEEMLSRTNAKQ